MLEFPSLSLWRVARFQTGVHGTSCIFSPVAFAFFLRSLCHVGAHFLQRSPSWPDLKNQQKVNNNTNDECE